MRKYIKPEMVSIIIEYKGGLLAGSAPGVGSEYSGGTVLSPEFTFDESDDE